MSDKFTFSLDRDRGLVRISMHGFYRIEDVDAFFDARRQAHAVGLLDRLKSDLERA